jgi:hypothetical protein
MFASELPDDAEDSEPKRYRGINIFFTAIVVRGEKETELHARGESIRVREAHGVINIKDSPPRPIELDRVEWTILMSIVLCRTRLHHAC